IRCRRQSKPPTAGQELRRPAPAVLPARALPPAPRPKAADTPASAPQQIVYQATGFLGAGSLGAGFQDVVLQTIRVLTASLEPARPGSAMVRSDPWFRHWKPRQPWLAALRSPR